MLKKEPQVKMMHGDELIKVLEEALIIAIDDLEHLALMANSDIANDCLKRISVILKDTDYEWK